MSARDDLKAEAVSLNLTFPGNISNVKLKAMVAEAKEPADDLMDGPPPVDEVAPPSPAVKTAPVAEEDEDIPEESYASPARKVALRRAAKQRARVADARRRAFQTRIITITNKDNRENDVMTTVYLAFENQYFGIAKLVPLDVPVELEAALIKIAAATTMTLHKDEIVNGNRTGNKVPVTVKKFAISYAIQPN